MNIDLEIAKIRTAIGSVPAAATAEVQLAISSVERAIWDHRTVVIIAFVLGAALGFCVKWAL